MTKQPNGTDIVAGIRVRLRRQELRLTAPLNIPLEPEKYETGTYQISASKFQALGIPSVPITSCSFMQGIKTGLVASSIFAAILGQALAAEYEIYYGSRAGMSLTTISKEGIGTSQAVIRVAHTPQNAKAFCVEYVLDNSMECVRRTMAEVQVNEMVTADCEQKTWVDVYGNRYAFLGPNESNQISADYTVKDLATGAILDGSSASGYSVALQTFNALCPGIAE